MTEFVKCMLVATPFFAQSFCGLSAMAQDAPTDAALTTTIPALGAKVFDAYNRCDLTAFGIYFAPNVESYHDQGGATFDRKTVVANTKKYICR